MSCQTFGALWSQWVVHQNRGVVQTHCELKLEIHNQHSDWNTAEHRQYFSTSIIIINVVVISQQLV